MDGPLNILTVTDAWKWFAEAELMFLSVRELSRRGHRVAFACQPSSPVVARAEAEGIPWHPLPGLRRPRLPTTPVANVVRLRRIIESVRPDVVHAWRSPPHVLSVSALKLMGRAAPPLVRTRGGAQTITRGRMNRALYDRWTDATFVTSRQIRDDMVRSGFDESRLRTLPQGVDLARLERPDPAAFRARHGLPADAPVVGVLGRLAEVKGHAHVVDALPALRAAHPNLVVCFTGPDADVAPATLRARAEALGVADALVLTGADPDAASALAAFDVVVVSSIGSEVIARVVLEAMAIGRPMVATRVGVIPELVEDGTTGRLVTPGDPEALASAVSALLADPDGAAAMGARAQAQVEARHGLDPLGDALEAVYREVLAGR